MTSEMFIDLSFTLHVMQIISRDIIIIRTEKSLAKLKRGKVHIHMAPNT